MPNTSNRLDFTLELLPPSVNHYAKHFQRDGRTIHAKTKIAKGFEQSFQYMLPAHIRDGQSWVTAEKFSVTLWIVPGPGDSTDIDNYPKMILDCIAKAGLLRKTNGKQASDAWVKRLVVDIDDDQATRERWGPRVRVLIEERVNAERGHSWKV